ncbi:MAG TPA: chromate transporter [Firmicutes bacterium]|jgi:chromate transporter|nr:chromate transporter [Bacillota bacterium]
MILLDLLLTFMQIGLFTFGGGYAMISMIENICVEKKKWLSHDDLMNITVIAESTPGPIAINCATYVGYRQGGLIGSMLATLGIVLPSFVVIYLIAMVFDNFLAITIIAGAFKGIKAAVGILILDAGIKMMRKMPKKLMPRMIMASAFIIVLLINILSWRISTITLMLTAATISLVVYMAKGATEQKGGAQY